MICLVFVIWLRCEFVNFVIATSFLFIDCVLKPDIILGTKNNLDGSICSSEIFPHNYEIFRKRQKHTVHGGGAFIAVRYIIVALPQPNLSSDAEMIWIKLQFTNSKLLHIGAYTVWRRFQPSQHTMVKQLTQNTHTVWRGQTFISLASSIYIYIYIIYIYIYILYIYIYIYIYILYIYIY